MELPQQCLARYVDVQCEGSTAKRYRQLLRSHTVPGLGEMPVGTVEREHIVALHHVLRDKRKQAKNVLWVLSEMFSLAEACGWRRAGTNPCQSVRPYKANRHKRFLSRAEYRRAGRALHESDSNGSVWPPAVAAIRLLMLTGWRREVIATLR